MLPSPHDTAADPTVPSAPGTPRIVTTPARAGHDTWERRHATLTAWKASRTLDRALGELRDALDDDGALEPEVRSRLSHASDATSEARRTLEELQTYLRRPPAPTSDEHATG